jgi:hypothetical protein
MEVEQSPNRGALISLNPFGSGGASGFFTVTDAGGYGWTAEALVVPLAHGSATRLSDNSGGRPRSV